MCNFWEFWDSQKILNLISNFFLLIFYSLNCENFLLQHSEKQSQNSEKDNLN